MEKTVLNQLLEWCKEFDDKNYHPTHTNMKEKIWQLLPKEKEQMCKSGQLLSFFLWFRANGELHLDKSIEAMIEIYLKESNLR